MNFGRDWHFRYLYRFDISDFERTNHVFTEKGGGRSSDRFALRGGG